MKTSTSILAFRLHKKTQELCELFFDGNVDNEAVVDKCQDISELLDIIIERQPYE